MFRSEEEMMEWMTILLGTIRDNKEKMKSLKRGEVCHFVYMCGGTVQYVICLHVHVHFM